MQDALICSGYSIATPRPLAEVMPPSLAALWRPVGCASTNTVTRLRDILRLCPATLAGKIVGVLVSNRLFSNDS
jgi:hypothetical protein